MLLDRRGLLDHSEANQRCLGYRSWLTLMPTKPPTIRPRPNAEQIRRMASSSDIGGSYAQGQGEARFLYGSREGPAPGYGVDVESVGDRGEQASGRAALCAQMSPGPWPRYCGGLFG